MSLKSFSFIDLDKEDFIKSDGLIIKQLFRNKGKATTWIDKYLSKTKVSKPVSYKVICWSDHQI